jgi:integrase
MRASGSQSFVLQYKFARKNRRFVLGSVTTLDLGKARTTAKDLLAKIRLGRDPAGERFALHAAAAETFGALLPRYLAFKRAKLKPRSFEEVERHLTNHAKPLHARGVESIDRRAIAVLLPSIAERCGPYAANSVRTSLSGYFVWLAREGIIESNPVAFTNKAAENGARERVLSDDEIASIWRAAGDSQYGSIIKLLILTGARRNEIAGLCWSEIDVDDALITLPGARTKNRRVHEIPLGSLALATIQAQPQRARDLVFGYGGSRGWQDWSGSKRDIDARANVSQWRLHDFRRTMSTVMHDRLDIQPHIVEAILGHISGHKGGVAGVYNHAAYRSQKRAALDKWAVFVETLVSGKIPTATVVKLRRRR